VCKRERQKKAVEISHLFEFLGAKNPVSTFSPKMWWKSQRVELWQPLRLWWWLYRFCDVNQWSLFSKTHANQKGYVVGHLMTKATTVFDCSFAKPENICNKSPKHSFTDKWFFRMCCNFRSSISDKKASQYLATKDCLDKSDKSVFGYSLLYHLDNMDFHPGCKR